MKSKITNHCTHTQLCEENKRRLAALLTPKFKRLTSVQFDLKQSQIKKVSSPLSSAKQFDTTRKSLDLNKIPINLSRSSYNIIASSTKKSLNQSDSPSSKKVEDLISSSVIQLNDEVPCPYEIEESKTSNRSVGLISAFAANTSKGSVR